MIDKRMAVREVTNRYPETIAVFEKYGLVCAGCDAALFENIEQGADIHGADIDALVDSLNKIVREK